MRFVDLSHTVEHGMITYPGLPAPWIGEHLGFEESTAHYDSGTEFAIGRISMVANTGTYLDTPAHRFRAGHDLSALPLSRCVDLPAVVVDGTGAIGSEAFSATNVAGKAVLLRTGWDKHWGTERYGERDHPHLTDEGARLLVEHDAVLVGIDSVNIDGTTTGSRPAHTRLLDAAIPIVEHLTGLAELPTAGARFTAVPVPVRGLASFPVRAFAQVP